MWEKIAPKNHAADHILVAVTFLLSFSFGA